MHWNVWFMSLRPAAVKALDLCLEASDWFLYNDPWRGQRKLREAIAVLRGAIKEEVLK